jgi:hypothetical protein
MFLAIDTIHAESAIKPATEATEQQELAKAKRGLIKSHQKSNKKLEKKIEIKSKKIEKILVTLPEDSLIPDSVIESQLGGKMEIMMDHLMQIGEVELSAWDNLKSGNKLIEAKKYSAGLKKLDIAIKNLETKHEMLIVLNQDFDDFIAFLNSIQAK